MLAVLCQRASSTLQSLKLVSIPYHKINSQYDEKENRYSDDAFARYMAGVLFESKGNYDSAIIEYQKSQISRDHLFGVVLWNLQSN